MQHRITKTAYSFFLIVCLSISFSTFGQTGKKMPLSTLMHQLEQTHHIRFSYVPKEVKGVEVFISEEVNDLQTILDQLNQQTNFKFTLLRNRYVTVVHTPKKPYCGKIIAWGTGEPLAGATVLVPGTSFSTVSNASGFFYIDAEVPRKTLVTISYMGYFPLSLSVNELATDCLTIVMHPRTSQLNNVLIKTYLVQGISKKTDGSIQLNTAAFGLLPGQVENDVLQIVQALPGVESVNETISNINIRGGASFETLLLWDDIKIYQSGHFFGLISAFNPHLTHEVSIYKNGTPPRFGEGISGVIAMRSKNKVAKEFSGGVGFNLINGSAFAEIPLSKNASLQVSGRHSLSFLKTPVYDNYSERMFQNTEIRNIENPNAPTEIATHVDFSFYDISTKLLWDISEKDAFRVNFLTLDNRLNFTESIGNSGSKTSELQQQSIVGGISWQRNWSSKIKTTALVYGTYYLLNATNKDLFTTQEQFQENEVLETGIKLNSRFLLSEKFSLRSGYQFVETGIANTQAVNLPRFRDYKKEVLRKHALFSNLTFTPNKQKTTLNVGARITFFNKFDKPSIEPRFSLHQKLGKGFTLEVMGELMSQTTTQRIDFESDFLGVEKRRWVLSNEVDVPILKSKQVSLGLSYDQNDWLVSLESFYKNVTGITTSSQAFQNQFQFVQANGNYTAKGLEFIINKRTQRFSTWFSYLLMQNDYEFKTLVPSEFPNNIDVRHSATLASSFNLKNFKLALGLKWHSGKPYTVPVPGEEIVLVDGQKVINFAAPNQEQLPDYLRADFSAQYHWEISKKVTARINVALLNFLDTENTLDIHYALGINENGDSRINKVEEISLGLTPKVSVQVLF